MIDSIRSLLSTILSNKKKSTTKQIKLHRKIWIMQKYSKLFNPTTYPIFFKMHAYSILKNHTIHHKTTK
mgnify:CR=1 FL=1